MEVSSSDTSIRIDHALAAPARMPGKKPALKLTGTQRPAIAIPRKQTAPVLLPAPARNGVDAAAAAGGSLSTARQMTTLPTAESVASWVDAGDEYAIRFSCSADGNRGNAGDSDWEYFRTDHASLMERAELIAGTLGFSAPLLAVIVEPERAASYRQLADGFAGAYCGPGCSVDMMLELP
jgi:hypothetical protein